LTLRVYVRGFDGPYSWQFLATKFFENTVM